MSLLAALQPMEHLEKPVALIVEDEPTVRMVAVEAFRDAGFEVVEAGHAAEALGICAPERVALLFTDVNMPGILDGIDLAERLVAMMPDLCVIITSAVPVLRPIDHLRATFVSKPYSPTAVSDTATRMLAA